MSSEYFKNSWKQMTTYFFYVLYVYPEKKDGFHSFQKVFSIVADQVGFVCRAGLATMISLPKIASLTSLCLPSDPNHSSEQSPSNLYFNCISIERLSK